MALSIKTQEADRLARELATQTGESLTTAVTIALQERLDRVRRQGRVDTVTRLDRLTLEYCALPVVDPRSPEEILGYDDVGLPT